MNVDQALKSLRLKGDLLEGLIQKCRISRDCVFTRLKVRYDYTHYADVDAVIVTPQKVHLLEIVTWKGSFKRESKTHWIREEPVSESASTVFSSPTVVNVRRVQVPNPVFEAERKLKYLTDYLKSKIGPGSVRDKDFDYHVIAVKGCTLSEDCLDEVVRYALLDEFAESLRQSWGGWLTRKVWPFYWPFWITYYSEIKRAISEVPTVDRLKLLSGEPGTQKLYGEMKSCPGVPYDRISTSQLIFRRAKTHKWRGIAVIKAQAVVRDSGKYMFDQPLQCNIDSTLEFHCEGLNEPISIKLEDVDNVTLSRPLQ